MSVTETICDCCGREIDVEDAQTCVCGATVCERCVESTHYMCEDEETAP